MVQNLKYELWELGTTDYTQQVLNPNYQFYTSIDKGKR